MSWIANAEAGSSVRAKLNVLIVPISSVAISSPVEYVDIALPAGYAAFQLLINQLAFDTADNLAGAFSSDGGTTFDNDASNFDTYQASGRITKSAMDQSHNGVADVTGCDALADFRMYSAILSPDSSIRGSGTLIIDPGSASSFPTVQFKSVSVQHDPFDVVPWLVWMSSSLSYNLLATTPPTVGRRNLLRLQPQGNDDCNPPTSGELITSGQFHLFGIPSA